ncbi:MAG: SDR family NAD(P)-dependent oxidoreductase [Gammaproteobacteria bacterium]
MVFPILQDKVAIITGGTVGIGKYISRAFAERGAHVFGVARRQGPGEALAAEIGAAGRSFTFVPGDVTRDADCRRAVDAALAAHGRVDILINNAGASGDIADAEHMSEENWDRVFELNSKAPFLMCRAVLPHMRARRDGVILNIASINAVIAPAAMGAYNASKAAVVHYSRTVAIEMLDHGVRCNAIIMGNVPSELSIPTSRAIGKSVRGEQWEPQGKMSPLWANKVYKARDVARALAMLCADDSAAITGAAIAIDKGISAGALSSQMIQLGCSELLPDGF